MALDAADDVCEEAGVWFDGGTVFIGIFEEGAEAELGVCRCLFCGSVFEDRGDVFVQLIVAQHMSHESMVAVTPKSYKVREIPKLTGWDIPRPVPVSTSINASVSSHHPLPIRSHPSLLSITQWLLRRQPVACSPHGENEILNYTYALLPCFRCMILTILGCRSWPV
jgi:hypothetical protein